MIGDAKAKVADVASYPPAIAPTTKNGSWPDATLGGSGLSGDSSEKS
jgi:hypothetical protein